MKESLESIPVPAVRVDSDGIVADANSAATTLFARSRKELIGGPSEQLSPELDLDEQPAVPPGRIPLANGEAILVFSERCHARRLQKEVYHLSRLASVGRLVTTVVHEINNALSGIVGYSQLLLAGTLGEECRSDLQRVHEEALRTSKVVQNLLRFSRQSRGKKTAIKISELLERCAHMKRLDFALKSIDLQVECESGVPVIEGDDPLLSQVFLNLLSNAEHSIHGVRERGQVTIRVHTEADRVLVDVSDNGPGIPPQRRKRIFEPFFTSRPGGGGTGLGLTLCQEILREHGAQISLLDREGSGACFRVSLLLANPVARPPATRRSPKPARAVRNKKIVVVEDEHNLRELLARAFQGHGNSIVTFESGDDALSYLLAEKVDLVLSDIHRPGLDGIGLYYRLARSRPQLLHRFLFLTGDTVSEKTDAFLRRSQAAYLSKPVLIPELTEKAREILERPTGQGELFA